MRRIVVIAVAILAAVVVLALLYNARRSGPRYDGDAAQLGAASGNKAIPAPSASPPDDGNWTMPGKDYASTRFSGLNQLTPANVGKLQVAFTFSTGTTEGFEAPP